MVVLMNNLVGIVRVNLRHILKVIFEILMTKLVHLNDKASIILYFQVSRQPKLKESKKGQGLKEALLLNH